MSDAHFNRRRLVAGLAVAAAVAQDPRTYGGSPIQRLRADERPRAFEVMQSICANVKVSLSSDPPSRRALLHLTQGIKALKLQSLLTAILGGIRGECARHDIQSRHHLVSTVQRRAKCPDRVLRGWPGGVFPSCHLGNKPWARIWYD